MIIHRNNQEYTIGRIVDVFMIYRYTCSAVHTVNIRYMWTVSLYDHRATRDSSVGRAEDCSEFKT